MEIQLTQGKVATIDDVDADLAALKWCVKKNRKGLYAHRGVRKQDGTWTTELLHQVVARRMGIVGPPDHKDRNGLNNRRDNLRPDPNRLNEANIGIRVNNTSGYKGVCWHRGNGKYAAYVSIDRKRRHLGYFDDPVEAAKAYDCAATAAFGEFAFLNFPETRSL